ncbi:uncharacterized protein LOC110690063 isoform X2 [Chenopodium quinoa]|uniref:uncharacterized protein LOC110690063 isoform X2 n=1 Tax=Chenopodium quinoa TaxID=63459 RepID=UPI000B774C2B|nr:uncharacterized protein LOC110690063 isoform X2 [Chenopodium quinoa]XP_021722604.1 uncharacterized protein LOC110690063 isoform X2 [Chenopodium quinoa]
MEVTLESYELAMGGGADSAVAGPETRKVSISFSCLLQQVVEYLKIPQPAYYLVDTRKNAVKLVPETDPSLGFYVYEGGPAKKVGELRERAAENVFRSLRMEYNIQVGDLTSKKIKKLQRCEFLYQIKRIELESMEREAGKVPVKWPDVPNQKRCKKYVCIDYMDVLRTLIVETKARVSPVETFKLGPAKFISWLTIYAPSIATGMECIFSAVRADCKATKQEAAKRAVDFLRTAYNLDIVDLKYGNGFYAGIKCSLARESYLAAKERVLGIQGALHLAPFLGEDGCITPKSVAHRILTPTLPPPPPHKARARPSFGDRLSQKPFSVPPELDNLFKRRKFD